MTLAPRATSTHMRACACMHVHEETCPYLSPGCRHGVGRPSLCAPLHTRTPGPWHLGRHCTHARGAHIYAAGCGTCLGSCSEGSSARCSARAPTNGQGAKGEQEHHGTAVNHMAPLRLPQCTCVLLLLLLCLLVLPAPRLPLCGTDRQRGRRLVKNQLKGGVPGRPVHGTVAGGSGTPSAAADEVHQVSGKAQAKVGRSKTHFPLPGNRAERRQHALRAGIHRWCRRTVAVDGLDLLAPLPNRPPQRQQQHIMGRLLRCFFLAGRRKGAALLRASTIQDPYIAGDPRRTPRQPRLAPPNKVSSLENVFIFCA